jgi:NAD(P)-dependent dehydrogenase (short-subunit alcohol dehydrogenase family)
MSGVFFPIRVGLACLCCFATLSQFLRQFTLRQQGTLLWDSALGRIGQSEEMASAILFLVLDASSYCTAFDLVADGGIT